MPSGAFGFMSNISTWLGPPYWKRKMTFFARGLMELFNFEPWTASAPSNFGIVKPSKPNPPTLSAWRRDKRKALNPGQAEYALSSFMDAQSLARRNGRAMGELDSSC